MGGDSTKGGIFGLPVSPITRKINEALGLVEKEKKTPPVLPTPIVSPVARPEGGAEESRKKRGRRLTVLTAGSTVPEGQELLNSETGVL